MLEIDQRKKYRSGSLLETDFSSCQYHLQEWRNQNEKKAKIYSAFREYIECLENSLKNEDDPLKKISLQREIKKLKKEQKKYYVPSVLEMNLSNEDSLGESSKTKKKRFKS